jgi:rubrerythrin
LAEHFRQLEEHFRQLAEHLRQLAEHFRQLEEHFRQLAEHFRQLAERFRQLAERFRQLAESFIQEAGFLTKACYLCPECSFLWGFIIKIKRWSRGPASIHPPALIWIINEKALLLLTN